MNRLFPTLAIALLCALGLSLAASWYLQVSPPFRANLDKLEREINTAADQIRPLLTQSPEPEWDDLIFATDLDRQFDINWYSIKDSNIPVEDLALLRLDNRITVFDNDDTPTAEMLFPEQEMVLTITSLHSPHQFFNTATMVLTVLAICFAAAALGLVPIAKRLKKLQLLAENYAQGNWQKRNTDKSPDQIGHLGASMENMATRIHHLMDSNNTLVQNQRDLMQAVAHEFRAPMARMRFALEIDEHIADSAASTEISNALDELNDMVSEVLLYSRMQISAPELTFSVVSQKQLLTECTERSRVQFPDVKISFTSDAMHNIQADPVHLKRAFTNLISNAAKYGNKTVNVRTSLYHGSMLVDIDDDGDGIPVDQRQRALKPFIRLDSSRTRKLGGTGLGLAIAHSVVVKHHGTLSISDSPLGGARVTISLPTASSEPLPDT